MKNIAEVWFGDSAWLSLNSDGTWESSENALTLSKLAAMLSRPPYYEYSPAHGAFGAYAASLVAKKLGGELFLPETETTDAPPEEGIVF